jgi:hypothetical protein
MAFMIRIIGGKKWRLVALTVDRKVGTITRGIEHEMAIEYHGNQKSIQLGIDALQKEDLKVPSI